MIVETLPLSLPLPAGGPPRSPGIHASSVIKCIAGESRILKPEYVDSLELIDLNQPAWWEGLEDHNRLRMALGMAWEQWYLPQLGTVVYQPGEMLVDGIYMTPDGESIDTIWMPSGEFGLTLHECKFTYKSTKTVGNLLSQWLWLTQTKGYCKGMQVLTAILHVLFACGDYTYPIRPVLKVFRITYTQGEIDESWDLVTGYVRHRQLLEREALEYGQEGA